jgi:hypothetical protein
LGVGDILHPAGYKTGYLKVKGGRAGKDLDVARPAQPFVALRTISRDVNKVILFLSAFAICLIGQLAAGELDHVIDLSVSFYPLAGLLGLEIIILMVIGISVGLGVPAYSHSAEG